MLALAVFLFTQQAVAVNLPTYYPTENLHMFAADGKTDLGPWVGSIGKTFILGEDGKPYVSGSGTQPLGATEGKVFLGTRLKNGTIVALPVDHLTTVAHSAAVEGASVRTPAPGACAQKSNGDDLEAGCKCDTATPQGTSLPQNAQQIQSATDFTCRAPTAGLDPEIAKMLLDFHNNFCEHGRKPAAEASAASDMQALSDEWQKFVDSQPPERKAKAELARSIDYVARTAAFESAVAGERDGVKNATCTDASACPRSACEMRIIALTVKNRAQHLKGDDPLVKAATNKDSYDIWRPSDSSPMITACLLRQGIWPGSKLPGLEKAILQYRLSLTAATQVLTQSADQLFSLDHGDAKELDHIANYFHPPGMDGCEPDRFATYKRTNGAAYIYQMDGDKVLDISALNNDFLSPDPTVPSVGDRVAVQIRQRRAKLDYTQENPTHRWMTPDCADAPCAKKKPWFVAQKDMHIVKSSNLCKPFGLPAYPDQKTCPGRPPAEYYRQIPDWAFNQPLDHLPQITCKGLAAASFGGRCDRDMQIIIDR